MREIIEQFDKEILFLPFWFFLFDKTNTQMVNLPHILPVKQIDILTEKEFEIDCRVRGCHCFKYF